MKKSLDNEMEAHVISCYIGISGLELSCQNPATTLICTMYPYYANIF